MDMGIQSRHVDTFDEMCLYSLNYLKEKAKPCKVHRAPELVLSQELHILETMAIRVHGIPISTATARVLLCLREKGIAYEFVPIDFAAGHHKQEPFLCLNPFGMIPALEDGDITLFESRAINRYLARKHKNIGIDLLGSNSSVESASVDTWMDVEAHQFDCPISTIINHIVINPLHGIPSNEQIVDSESQKLGKVLDVYEERLSKNKYLAGDHYSLADLHHIPFLIHLMRTPKASIVTSRPRVNSWWNEISSRPATIEVSEALKL